MIRVLEIMKYCLEWKDTTFVPINRNYGVEIPLMLKLRRTDITFVLIYQNFGDQRARLSFAKATDNAVERPDYPDDYRDGKAGSS